MEEEIQRAIDALPKRQRSIAKLRLLEGLGYREIAKRLGGSAHTVKSLFSVARKTLQMKLQFYLSCFAFPWRISRGRVKGSEASTSTSTSVSGIVSVAAHLIVAAAIFYGSMGGVDTSDSLKSKATSLAIITSSADMRHPLSMVQSSSRIATVHPNLSSPTRKANREMPRLEHRKLKTVLPPQTPTVLDPHPLPLASGETGLAFPDSIPATKPIAPDQTAILPQFSEHSYQRSDRTTIDRSAPQANSSNEIAPLVPHLNLPDESFGESPEVVREKYHPMQASLRAISNSFRRLRAVRSVQDLDAYSLAQFRRVARKVGQHPLLISRCNTAYLRVLLAEGWTPIVILRSSVGGKHPWVIAAWDTDAAQVTLTNPLEEHTKQLSEAAFTEAWQGGTSPSMCLLLATRPLPKPFRIHPSSQTHASTLAENSPHIWY